VVAACSAGGTVPSSTVTPAPTPSATPAASPSARTCVSSSVGAEQTCALDAGTYSTAYLEPRLTYTVPTAGWASLDRQASPGNFHLFPPGGSLAGFDAGTTDDLTVLSAVAAPEACTGAPSTGFAQSLNGVMKFLTTDTHIKVSNLRDASIGGLHGKELDIAFVRGDGCSDGTYTDLLVGVDPSHGDFAMAPAMVGAHLYLVGSGVREAPLAILIDDAKGGSDFGDGTAWLTAANAVVTSFVFRH
jgi:hypothetical protein